MCCTYIGVVQIVAIDDVNDGWHGDFKESHGEVFKETTRSGETGEIFRELICEFNEQVWNEPFHEFIIVEEILVDLIYRSETNA